MIPFLLVIRLLETLNLKNVGLCLQESAEDDLGISEAFDFVTDLLGQGNYFSFWLAGSRVPEAQHGVLLVCDLSAMNTSEEPNIFRSQYHWLSPENHANASTLMSLLPMRLDSKVFTYKLDHDKRDVTSISEWYKLKGKFLFSLEHGFKGAKLSLPHIWERRRDLKGVKLTNGFVPLKAKNPIIMQQDDGSMAGSMIDILNSMKASLNFTSLNVLVPDNDFGVMDDNGSWTGVVRQLQDRNYDISFTGLTATPSRQSVIDFTNGVIEDVTTLIVRNPALYGKGTGLDITGFLTIFSKLTWLLIGAHICVFAFIFMLKATFKESTSRLGYLKQFLLGAELHYVTLMQLGSNVCFNKLSEKIAYLTIATLSIVLFATYTGDLTAFMTAGAPQSKIRTFEDILKLDKTVATVAGTVEETLLYENSSSSTAKSKVKKEIISPAADNYFERVVEDDLALYFSYLQAAQRPNVVALMDFQDSFSLHFAVGLQKDSELMGLFNYQVSKMTQSGLLSHIIWKWVSGKPADMSHRIFAQELDAVGFDNLFFPTLVVAGGIALAAFALCVEFFIRKNRRLEETVDGRGGISAIAPVRWQPALNI